MKNLKIVFTLLVAVVFVAGLSACAEGTGGEGADTTDTAMSALPSDSMGMQNGGMRQDSMQQGSMGMAQPTAATYNQWDANGDSELTEDEFWDGVWNEWDADGNGNLNESEFNDGSDWLFGNAYQFGWEDWDADGNGTLTEAEYQQGWDQYDDGLFDDSDANANGWLSEQEFKNNSFGSQNGQMNQNGGM